MGEDVFGLVGRTIDEKVRVEDWIGEGGFAVVYRGFHLAFEQPVALKCLKTPGHFDSDAQHSFLSKFKEEGKMLFRLSQHASIVRVFDLGEVVSDKGVAIPYLVLEWLDGVDLETLVKRRASEGLAPLTETEVLRLLRPVVDAIALAHRLGIAHRDLKPTNLLLANTVQGELLKVLDFGIAKAMQEGETTAERSTRTSSGFHAFSPQYGAPEQFRSKRFGATGPWTDVHAIGLILTELVVGRPAMLGEEHGDFFEQAMDESRPTPRSCGATVSDAFETFCQRCLTRDPAQRIQDADGVLAAMDAVEMGVRDMMSQGLGLPEPKAIEATEAIEAPEATGAQFPLEVPSLVPPKPAVPVVSAVPPVSAVSSNLSAAPAQPSMGVGTSNQPRVSGRSRWLLVGLVGMFLVGMVALLLWFLPTRKHNQTENALGETILVPGGSFRMGAAQGAPDQRPEHDVTVDAFHLDKTEVTVRAYALCVEEGGCQSTETVHLTSVTEVQAEKWNTFCNWGKPERESHPMNCVDWHQAQAFCAWAGKRLPTEREWEYAARGGDENRIYPWGDHKPEAGLFNGCGTECSTMALTHGWKWKPLHDGDDGWPATSPVGSFPRSVGRWGHHDLSGNVWEWTENPFCSYGSEHSCSKVHIVARGGGWVSRYLGIFRATFRAKYPREYRAQDVGFRCAR